MGGGGVVVVDVEVRERSERKKLGFAYGPRKTLRLLTGLLKHTKKL